MSIVEAEESMVDPRSPESFFDDQFDYKMNMYPMAEEIKHMASEPSDMCRDYFYRCMSEPRIISMIER